MNGKDREDGDLILELLDILVETAQKGGLVALEPGIRIFS
jgi:hypothetical protein